MTTPKHRDTESKRGGNAPARKRPSSAAGGKSAGAIVTQATDKIARKVVAKRYNDPYDIAASGTGLVVVDAQAIHLALGRSKRLKLTSLQLDKAFILRGAQSTLISEHGLAGARAQQGATGDQRAANEQAEAAAAELLADTDVSLEAIGRHGDRIDELLEQIKALRAETIL